MDKTKGYCEKCMDFTPCKVIIKRVKTEVFDMEYEYDEKQVYCTLCGSEVIDRNILNENVLKLQELYRKDKGLITISQIEELVKKYGIGKRNLSKLLGLGEITLTRYIDGDIPSKKTSNILLNALNDYLYALQLASDNKFKVDEKLYNKFANKVIDIIKNENRDKLTIVGKYIIRECKDITPLAIQKMLFLSQLLSFAFNEKELFEDTCEAWKYGPVYPKIYARLKKYSNDYIDSVEFEDINEYNFVDKEKLVIDSVIRNFGIYSGGKLIDMTHKMEPWIKARKGASDNENCNNEISNKSIASYAKKLKEKYNTMDIDLFCNKLIKESM